MRTQEDRFRVLSGTRPGQLTFGDTETSDSCHTVDSYNFFTTIGPSYHLLPLKLLFGEDGGPMLIKKLRVRQAGAH